MHRLIFPSDIWCVLEARFVEASPNETGAFLLIRPGRGVEGTRLLAHDVVLADAASWRHQGPHHLSPTSQWISSVVSKAVATESGVAFIHSHPDALHTPALSPIDEESSAAWSETICPLTAQPFASLVWSARGVTGQAYEPKRPGTPIVIEKIQVLGGGRIHNLLATTNVAHSRAMDDRQIRALGQLGNAELRTLTAAVVGLGGTGSPVAEQLARMGVAELILVDPDVVDDASNLRRIVGARTADLESRTPKVEIASRHIAEMGFAGKVDALARDVRTERSARRLLDADVVINTTDTHSSKAFLNQLALQYYLPTIDAGVRIGTALDGRVTGMPAEIRILLPDAGCLWCRGTLDAGRIREENLEPAERLQLEAEGYAQGVQDPQPSIVPLNFEAASLAVLACLRLLSRSGPTIDSYIVDGWELYAQALDASIASECLCHSFRGKGDDLPIAFRVAAEA